MSATYFSLGGGDDSTQRFFSTPKLPGGISLPTIIPHRLRRKFRSTKTRLRSNQPTTASITRLETSLNPADTLRSLKKHQWSVWDAQYIFLAILGIFSLCVIESPGPFAKTFVATLLILSLLIPLTRQFFLPFLPLLSFICFIIFLFYYTIIYLSISF